MLRVLHRPVAQCIMQTGFYMKSKLREGLFNGDQAIGIAILIYVFWQLERICRLLSNFEGKGQIGTGCPPQPPGPTPNSNRSHTDSRETHDRPNTLTIYIGQESKAAIGMSYYQKLA